MEIILLDDNFNVSTIIDDFSSLLWNRKYYAVGNFNLEISSSYYEVIKLSKYIYRSDCEETGIIENIKYSTKNDDVKLELSGRFLESILGDRVIDNVNNFYDKTENICRTLVNNLAIISRKIDKLKLGNNNQLGSTIRLQVTGENLLEELYLLCKNDELSIKVKYDYLKNYIIFEIWQGLNRTDLQTLNSWATFSENFENIDEDNYYMDSTKYKNFAYVAGQDKGTNRVIVCVDKILNGEKRKEIYIDARDLQQEDNMTNKQYEEILFQRGLEKLEENKKVETIDFKINPHSNLKYKTDFDLGDKVTYKNEKLGYYVNSRIVEISEVYENGDEEISITFGDDYNIKLLKGE
ncbi:MAG: siphovirus ReqiPepy6 Gp37-like family protein [Clostridia bacterium]